MEKRWIDRLIDREREMKHTTEERGGKGEGEGEEEGKGGGEGEGEGDGEGD